MKQELEQIEVVSGGIPFDGLIHSKRVNRKETRVFYYDTEEKTVYIQGKKSLLRVPLTNINYMIFASTETVEAEKAPKPEPVVEAPKPPVNDTFKFKKDAAGRIIETK